MEITNCEQYVLAELDYEQRRNERLAAENNKLAKQLDAMTKRANGYSRIINRPKTPIYRIDYILDDFEGLAQKYVALAISKVDE